jgi:cholesterol transport system auxiliary component
MTRAFLTAAAGLLLAFDLSGCGGKLFQSAAPTSSVYGLRVLPAAAALTPQIPALLIVMRPAVRPGLDTDRIVLQHADRRLDSYAGGRWGGALAEVVHSLLIEGLQAQGGWQGVLGEQSSFTGRYLLQTEVRDFVADYAAEGKAPTVRVSFACELGDNQSRRIVGSFVVTTEQAAASNTLHDVVAAFEAALQQATIRVAAAAHAAAASATPQPP